MTKYVQLVLAVGAAAAACSYSPEAPAASAASRPMPQGGRQASVTSLWMENCAKCHGQRGEGGGAGTRTLLTEALFDQKHDKPFFDAIKNGVPDMGMEAYGTTLTDEQIWGLVVHIRELQGQALRREKGSPRAENGVYRMKGHNYRIETVVDRGLGLETPWALDWLPDGRMLITNRPGTFHLWDKGNLVAIEGTPQVVELGQGGLMDVTVHPDYAKNGWIYLAYTEPSAAAPRSGMTKIVRGKLDFSGGTPKWTGQQTLWEADQKFYTRAGVHFGSRVVFDGKGMMYFIVGERGGNMLAQQLESPFGKVYRLKDDGTVPADNPFVKDASKGSHVSAIWTLGHRNPQGMTFDPEGNLWVTEHGPRGGDELNMLKKGANYGWPVIAFSINYSDAPFRTPWPAAGQNFAMPAFRWIPSIGACGLDTVKGAAFPNWKGDLLAGGLVGQNVDRIRVKNGVMVEREEIVHGLGRVRDVVVAKDGTIYLALNGPDKIVRLVPAK